LVFPGKNGALFTKHIAKLKACDEDYPSWHYKAITNQASSTGLEKIDLTNLALLPT
jgi:hypothetical protein